jgi:hypothetical protein
MLLGIHLRPYEQCRHMRGEDWTQAGVKIDCSKALPVRLAESFGLCQ